MGVSECSGRPILIFSLKKIGFCAIIINISLTRNLLINSGVRQWSHSLMISLHCFWSKSNSRTRGQFKYDVTWLSLVNKVSRVLRLYVCSSALSAQVLEYLKWPSGLSARVPFECRGVQVPLECSWSDLKVPLECILSTQLPVKCSSSKQNLQHYKKWTLIHRGKSWQFCRAFKNLSKYILYKHLLFSLPLEIRCVSFTTFC